MRLITIASYTYPYQAHLAADLLRNAGIPCVLRDENLVTMNLFYSNAIGGVKLVIPENNFDEATLVLSAMVKPDQQVIEHSMSESDKTICQACNSIDVISERRNGFLPIITNSVQLRRLCVSVNQCDTMD